MSGAVDSKACALAAILIVFFSLQALLPLGTAIMLGADEGFELAKATLCLKGYHLYTEIWNDQPPLLTFLVTGILKNISLLPTEPRLLTGLFSAVLLSSVFLMVLRVNGLPEALIAPFFIIASPGFLILGSSCMLEVPALATAIAALTVLFYKGNTPMKALIAGAVFGVSFEIKLINVILLPLVAFVLYSQAPSQRLINVTKSLILLGTGLVIATVVTDYVACRGAYLSHFQTALTSHFGPIKSSGHGSPADHPFDWSVFVKSWDTTLPAIVGLIVCVQRSRDDTLSLLPVAWLLLELIVFGIHRPWWHYYVVHTSVPTCWCAAIGWIALFRFALISGRRVAMVALISCSAIVILWMAARLYLQIEEVRHSPQTYTSLFLQEIARRKPHVQWMYCEEPIYSFHAQIPMPPDLAVVMLKRFWSGEITDEQIASDLATYKPRLILLRNNSIQRPFQALLDSDYQLVYVDNDHLLYARTERARRPKALHGIQSIAPK